MKSTKEMLFKNQRVFIDVDDKGSPIEKDGRATMRYRLDDERVYHPSVRNLSELENGALGKQQQAAARRSNPKVSPEKSSSLLNISETDVVSGQILAFTDGACLGNPGPAGLGYLINYPDGRTAIQGEPLGRATNNIAELTAILRVLELVDPKTPRVVIHTDSSYAIGVLTKNWKAKANQELIAQIRQKLARFSNVELRKVKGHAGIEQNELVDQLARSAAETQKTVK
jgi:ribonuclease HI